MPIDPCDFKSLKDELSTLKELQNKVTKQAVFGGMSPSETKEYDVRQQRMMHIVATLERESGRS
jgi:hypothetical protein